jgi:hypothetical protein
MTGVTRTFFWDSGTWDKIGTVGMGLFDSGALKLPRLAKLFFGTWDKTGTGWDAPLPRSVWDRFGNRHKSIDIQV